MYYKRRPRRGFGLVQFIVPIVSHAVMMSSAAADYVNTKRAITKDGRTQQNSFNQELALKDQELKMRGGVLATKSQTDLYAQSQTLGLVKLSALVGVVLAVVGLIAYYMVVTGGDDA